MNPYVRRLVFFLCLSMGLAFAAGPYPGTRLVSENNEAFFLSSIGLSESTLKPACMEKAVEIQSERFDEFPDLRKKMVSPPLSTLEGNETCLFGTEAEAFAERFNGRDGSPWCFTCDGRTYAVDRLLHYGIGQFMLVGLSTEPENIPVLPSSGLDAFPALQGYLDRLIHAADEARNLPRGTKPKPRETEPPKPAGSPSQDMDRAFEAMQKRISEIGGETGRLAPLLETRRRLALYAENPVDMAPAEWTALRDRLGQEGNTLRFRCGDYLLFVRSETTEEKVPKSVTWFKPLRYILAALFIGLGLLTARGLYGRHPGISLNPTWSIVAADAIVILFLGAGAFYLIDLGLARFPGMMSFVDDPAVVRVLCAVAYLPVAFFMAVYVTNLGGQSLEIESGGLRLHYPARMDFLPWDTITGYDLRQTYVPLVRGGIFMSRKLQNNLVIRTGTGEYTLVEPGLRKTKDEILASMKAAGPERLHGGLDRLRRDW